MDALTQEEIIATGRHCLARTLAEGPASRNDSNDTSLLPDPPDPATYAARIEKLLAVLEAIKQLRIPSSDLERIASELERVAQQARKTP